MAEISKTIADRLRIARAVLAGMEVRGAEVAREAARALHGGSASEAEVEKIAGLIADLRRSLREASERLAAAEGARVAELADDPEARGERDRRALTLRESLARARDAVRGSRGAGAVTRAGLDGEVPLRGDALVRYAQIAAGLVAEAELGEPLDAMVRVDLGALGAALGEEAQALRASLDAVEDERGELQAALAAREEAEEAQARIYLAAASVFESLCRLGGLDALAEQLRPTARRRRGRPEPHDRGR